MEIPTKSVDEDIHLLRTIADSKPWRDSTAWKSEAEFLSWLRSQSRRIWSRHPVKIDYKKSKEFKPPPDFPNKRVKTVVRCEICNNIFKKDDVEVDHILMAGSFKSIEEFKDWIVRLLVVDFDGLRLLCKKKCHPIVTLSQKLGCTFEEAVLEKKAIEFCKKKAKEQKKILLELGATEEEARNAKERRKCYKRVLEGEKK